VSFVFREAIAPLKRGLDEESASGSKAGASVFFERHRKTSNRNAALAASDSTGSERGAKGLIPSNFKEMKAISFLKTPFKRLFSPNFLD